MSRKQILQQCSHGENQNSDHQQPDNAIPHIIPGVIIPFIMGYLIQLAQEYAAPGASSGPSALKIDCRFFRRLTDERL